MREHSARSKIGCPPNSPDCGNKRMYAVETEVSEVVLMPCLPTYSIGGFNNGVGSGDGEDGGEGNDTGKGGGGEGS